MAHARLYSNPESKTEDFLKNINAKTQLILAVQAARLKVVELAGKITGPKGLKNQYQSLIQKNIKNKLAIEKAITSFTNELNVAQKQLENGLPSVTNMEKDQVHLQNLVNYLVNHPSEAESVLLSDMQKALSGFKVILEILNELSQAGALNGPKNQIVALLAELQDIQNSINVLTQTAQQTP